MRSPAGFVVSALRDGWDLSEALAAEQADRARARRRAEQDGAETAARSEVVADRARAQGWAAAVSAALDDRALARAVAAVSEPVAGVGRRSVPSTRAALVLWAATVAGRHPAVPLGEALRADLAAGPTCPRALDGGLPDPPAPDAAHPPDLSARIAALLQREERELSRPPSTRGAER